MDASIFYVELGGLYVQLLRKQGWQEPEPLLVVHRGRLLDHDTEVLRPGMTLAQARQRVPGARIVAARQLPAQGPWQLLARTVYRHTPRIQRQAPHRLFALPGAQKEPEHFFQTLCESLLPAGGRQLLGVLAPSRLLAGMLGQLWRKKGGLPACWQHRVRARSFDGGSGTLLLLTAAVWQEHGEALMAQTPVSWLWPLAAKEKEFLARRGLSRCGEVQQLPRQVLVDARGTRAAAAIHAYARGEDLEPFQINYPRARVQAALTLPEAVLLTGTEELRGIHQRLLQRLRRRLSRGELACRRLRCSLTTGDGLCIQRRRCFSLPRPGMRGELQRQGAAGASQRSRAQQGRELAAPAWALLRQAVAALALSQADDDERPVYLKQICFTADRLLPRPPLQLHLLSPPVGRREDAARSQQRAHDVLADLQQRFSGRTIDWGTQLEEPRREEMLAHWDPLRQPAARKAGRS